MPREKIAVNTTHDPEGFPKRGQARVLQVAWMPRTEGEDEEVGRYVNDGWAQISIAPADWKDTGDWEIINLDPDTTDHLIRTLKRARRKAWPRPNA